QVGWNQLSKPRDMYYRGFNEKPALPQMSEGAELFEAQDKGIDVLSGHHPPRPAEAVYDVEGVLLPRPFKITKIGPLSLFVDDVERAEAFYRERLGFVKSEEARYRGARCVFMRCGSEHHSLGLFPKELRGILGLSPRTTCMSFGVEVGSYAQLRAALDFLKAQGVRFIDAIPPELYPGIDYSAFALDPDGHCIQLYYYMEQVGWDGRVRPAAERRAVNGNWPEILEPLSDTYVDQVFQGPLG
ncbi:MAG: VOC family protein, partial [Alphaproteobacteria bacterium]|nr:VOC family protein [Alphaproteobacteria bacterium]